MISESQRLERRKYLGSSEIAAVMGLDPHRSASDVYLEKTGQAADFGGNDMTLRGELLEPALIAFAERQLGLKLDRDVMLVHPNGLLAANLDARNHDQKIVVEGKTTVHGEDWGADGTDEVPDRVIIQVHHQLAVAGPDYRVAYVPMLVPDFKQLDFRLYRIERNEQIIEAVLRAGCEFMMKHVRSSVVPSDFKPSLEVLKRVRRQPNKIIDVPDELVDQVIVARAARSQANKDCEEAERALLAVMLDAEAGKYSAGQVTYLEYKRAGYTVEPSSYRSLKFKKGK